MTSLIQTNQTTSLSPPVLEKPEPKPSAGLEKIRSNLLSSSGVTDQLSIVQGREISQLMSDYMGSDDQEETELSLTLEDFFSNADAFRRVNELLISTEVFDVFTKQFSPFDKEEMVVALGAKVGNLIKADSSLRKSPLVEMQTDNQKKLALHSLFVDAAIQVIEKYAEENDDTNSPTWKEDAIAQLKGNLKKAITHEIQQRYGNKETLLKADRERMAQWIQEITALQSKCKPLLTDSVLKEGYNEGITFTIKKNDKAYGYLFGTIHNLSFDEDHLTFVHISPKTQERLHECSILGTEVRYDLDRCIFENNVSLDFILAADANQHGIANIGIDDEHRDGLIVDIIPDSTSEQEDADSVVTSVMKAVYTGNLDELNQYGGGEFQKETYARLHMTCQVRNKSMADNIDALLISGEKATQDNNTGPMKGFFALGCLHLVDHPSAPVSVVQRLKEKGWTIEPIKK